MTNTQIMEWYFAFYPATILGRFDRETSIYSLFGHVEAFGYTADDTWLFFDPQGRNTIVQVAHRHDQVEELMAKRFTSSSEIIKISPKPRTLINPWRGPTTCVSQCAALIGWRAFTVQGFRSKLLRNGAEIIHGQQAKGRSRRQGSTPA